MASDQNIQKVLIREYNPHEIIVASGSESNRFYVIMQGTVEIIYDNSRIRILRDGDIFGIEYFYLKKPYSITAQTITKARIASYDTVMLNELVYDRPQLIHQLLTSVARQLEQTSLIAAKKISPEASASTGAMNPQGTPCTRDDGVDITITSTEPLETNFHDDILSCFIEESKKLLDDLKNIGESLKLVGIPDEKESAKLREFAQKLNRLIGGAASMGFEKFALLSRKTSLLATRCADIREMTIRIVISNLNLIVATLADCFKNLDTIQKAEEMVPMLEQRLDICMTAIGITSPDIKSQAEIDQILDSFQSSQN